MTNNVLRKVYGGTATSWLRVYKNSRDGSASRPLVDISKPATVGLTSEARARQSRARPWAAVTASRGTQSCLMVRRLERPRLRLMLAASRP